MTSDDELKDLRRLLLKALQRVDALEHECNSKDRIIRSYEQQTWRAAKERSQFQPITE